MKFNPKCFRKGSGRNGKYLVFHMHRDSAVYSIEFATISVLISAFPPPLHPYAGVGLVVEVVLAIALDVLEQENTDI